MADVYRIRVSWSGAPVTGGGVSTFYTSSAPATLQGALITFINAIKVQFPPPLAWEVPNHGDVIDSVSGKITNAWTGGTTTSILANGTSSQYAAGVGARVRWNTSGFVNGRNIKGSTYFVPLSSPAYDNDGTINPGVLGNLQTAATALVGAANMCIVTRPTSSTSNDGGFTAVSSATAVDKVSWLRSRRT